MLEDISADELRRLVVQQLLLVGILGIGIAAGAHIGVGHIQHACIDGGVLPQPGTEVTERALYQGTQCWQSAQFLANLANGAVGVGALCLLAGAVVDQFPDRVDDVLATLRGSEVEA